MTNSDTICNLIRKVKTPNELFIGATTYNWTYMIASYTADCTEALPLSIFDKTICGILHIDGAISFETLGDILGAHMEPLLHVVGPEHDNDKIQRPVGVQQNTQVAFSVLVAFHFVFLHGNSSAEAFLNDPGYMTKLILQNAGPPLVIVPASTGWICSEGVGVSEA